MSMMFDLRIWGRWMDKGGDKQRLGCQRLGCGMSCLLLIMTKYKNAGKPSQFAVLQGGRDQENLSSTQSLVDAKKQQRPLSSEGSM